MSTPQGEHPELGLLRMLRAALRAGLAPGANDEAFAMTRSAAQIVGLAGLDACLAALDAQRGGEWRGPALSVVEHLERLAGAESLSEFRAADDLLLARAELLRAAEPPLAGGLLGVDDVEELPPAEPPLGTLSVEEALQDLPLSGDAATTSARRARLSAPVAGSLRAALDWLLSDPERPRPFRLRAEDSVLEVQCEGVTPDGLLAAHEVLAEAGGALAPIGEVGARTSTGAWMLRVPAWSPRPVHLMLEQGLLRLAVPWHSVLRLSLVPAIEIEMRGGSLATPVLAPLTPLAEGVGERPVVAIAHGLKRALLVADRLVWRLGAEPCEPDEAPPAPQLQHAVRSEEGEVFWVADPRVLLEAVALPVLPPSGGKPLAPKPELPGEPEAILPRIPEPLVFLVAASGFEAVAPAPIEPDEAELFELSAADVEPVVLDSLDVEPLAAEVPAVLPLTVPAPLTEPNEVFVASAPPVPAEAPVVVAPMATVESAIAGLPPAAEGLEVVAPPRPAPPADETISTGDLIAEASQFLPEWLERFGTAGATPRGAETAGASATAVASAAAVLIAEDSLAARHFLARHFEQRGLAVHHVESAAALRAELRARAWSLVCVDVELPDARGPEFLAALSADLDAREIPLVALVRDDDDTETAHAGGVRRWLRKPFDGDEIDHLLSRLGLAAERNA